MEAIPFFMFFILLSTFFLLLISFLRLRKAANLPPGPCPLPIIGNINHLAKNPHQSLTQLAKTYGPIIHLKLGSIHTIVVSTPELIKQVLQKHDHTLSSRPEFDISTAHGHNKKSIIWLPPNNPKWRNLRRICKDKMFSMQRLDSSQGLRQLKLNEMRNYVQECCNNGRVVDIADVLFTTTLNLISTSLFSMDFAEYQSDSSQELKGIIHGIFVNLGTPNIADYFPVLKWFDPQGIRRKAAVYIDKIFRIFDDIIEQRLKSASLASNDLLGSLLEINQSNESELSRSDLLHLLLDLFVAGIDTTATTAEWAMSELIRNPKEMAKVRNEIRMVTGINQQVEESDISKLPYLQAVLKESYRLHPAGALIPPHKAEVDTEINGFVIPKNAQVLVNIYASGRDPDVWPNPDCFNPERFMGSMIDVKGRDFQLIPFGSGRRMCPGMPLANRVVQMLVVSLIQGFDWRVEGGIESEDLNMDDKFEFSLQRVVPLKAIPFEL